MITTQDTVSDFSSLNRRSGLDKMGHLVFIIMDDCNSFLILLFSFEAWRFGSFVVEFFFFTIIAIIMWLNCFEHQKVISHQ